MELNKSMLELNLTDFNKSIIKNLGKDVWRKINNDLDTSCVLLAGGSEKYKNLVYNYLVENNYLGNIT